MDGAGDENCRWKREVPFPCTSLSIVSDTNAFLKGDFTQALPKSSFTHIFVTFALNMLPEQTLSHLCSLLRPGGFIAVATWSAMP